MPNKAFLVALGMVISPGLASAETLWTTIGNMATPRSGHSATLLPSGTVLVAGGDGALSSAELYDSSAGTWSGTSSMGTGRSAHTATLLPSGLVLVAGGVGVDGTLASAELYDPTTGSWTPTGPMTMARSGHTQSLLLSGKVLITGGSGDHSLASAELYDPMAGTWSSTDNPMAMARLGHTATLLPSGKVLVAGGGNDDATAAEVYDPLAGTWASTGSMTTARTGHTAVLLRAGLVFVAGGSNENGTQPSTEVYDPMAGAWSGTAAMPTARGQQTGTVLPSGNVLVAGGLGNVTSSGELILDSTFHFSSAEFYDAVAGSWTSTGSMATARVGHTATLLLAGVVLVAGGVGVNGTLASAEVYDQLAGVAPVVVPEVVSLGTQETLSFSGTGGSGTGFVWSFDQNGSGASLDTAGNYTAGTKGSIPGVTLVIDQIRLTDSLGNSATALVKVNGTVRVGQFPPSLGPSCAVTAGDASPLLGLTVLLALMSKRRHGDARRGTATRHGEAPR